MLQLSYSWLAIAVDVSVKVLLLAMLAGLLLAVLRVRDANVRHRVWMALLGGMLAMPVLVVALRGVMPSVPLPTWMTLAWQVEAGNEDRDVVPSKPAGGVAAPDSKLPNERLADVFDYVDDSANSLPLQFADQQQEIDDNTAPLLAATPAHTMGAVNNAAASDIAKVRKPLASKPSQRTWIAAKWPILLTGFYLTVASMLLLRWAIGLLMVHRLVRQARHVNRDMTPVGTRNVRILEHANVHVPLTVGFLRPTVLLPSEWQTWSDEKLHAVLAHELAHVRRADWLVTMLAELNRAIYWYHPLAWFLKRKLSTLAEQSCDDAVLEANTGRTEYARYLLEVASSLTASGGRCRAPMQSVAMARIPSVETRIEAILDAGRPLARRLSAIGAAFLLAIGIPAILLAAALQAGDGESNEPIIAKVNESKPAVEANDDVQPEDDVKKVQGQVLGPDGVPIAGAKVVAATVLLGGRPGYPQFAHHVLGKTVSDEQGNFELDFSLDYPEREELEAKFKVDFYDWRRSHTGWQILAQADGYGPAWGDGAQVEADDSPSLRLTRNAPIEGRVVDLEGNPISGVSVRLRELQPSRGEQAILAWIKEAGEKPHPQTLREYFFRSDDRYPGPFPRDPNGGLTAGSPALPAAVATDGQGRFTFSGLGANCLAVLEIEGPNVTKSILHVVTREMEPVSSRKLMAIGVHTPVHYGRKFEFVAQPSQPIEGIVTDAETGEPIGDMLVNLQRFADNTFSQNGFLATRTDAQGRYSLDGAPQGGGHIVRVKPPVDAPYFETEVDIPRASTFEPIQRDVSLRKGIWIRGHVTDKESEEPIVGATVQYLPLRSNKHAEEYVNYDPRITGSVPDDRFRTSDDGAFRVLAIPGNGVVSAIAQGDDSRFYITTTAQDVPDHVIDERGRLNAYHPWTINGYHALTAIEIPESVDTVKQNLQFQRGLTRQVNLVDHEGQPIEGVRILGRTFPPNLEHRPLDSSKVEILGLRPNADRFVVLIHEDKKLGKALAITAGHETTVKLDACAVARGRVVDEDGQPMSGIGVRVSADRSDGWGRMLSGAVTGDDGKFEVLLPPGTQYRVWHYSPPDGPNFSVDCKPKPGDAIELGDMTDGTELDVDETAKRTVARQAANETKPNAMHVIGTVMQPNGKPLTGAKLYWPRTKTPQGLTDLFLEHVATSNDDGTFAAELVFPELSWVRDVPLIAIARGYGLAWVDVSPNPSHEQLTLKMAEEFPIRGRVLSTEGNPVPAASVTLYTVMTDSSGSIDKLLTAWRSEWQSSFMKIDKVLHVGMHLVGDVLEIQPTDQQGRFTISGLGKEHSVRIHVRAPSIANDTAIVVTRTGFEPDSFNEAALAQAGSMALRRRQTQKLYANNFTIVAEPGKVITGQVTDIETGQPLAGVVVDTSAGRGHAITTTTDADGEYSLSGIPIHDDDVLVSFRKPDTRYLPRTLATKLTPGLAAMEFNAGLAKGIVLNGRVSESETGNPVTGGIRFAPLEDNQWKDKPGYDNYKRSRVMESVDQDGNFEFVSIPGPGVLLMQVGRGDIEIGGQYVKPYRKGRFSREDREKVRIYVEGESFYTSSNGLEFFENGMKVIDIPEDVDAYTANLTVDRGVDVDVAIVDDQGQPLAGSMVCGVSDSWPITCTTPEQSIRIYALDPDQPRSVIFYHPQRQLACTLTIRGNENDPIVANLQPTKTLVGRAVHTDGSPLAGAKVSLSWHDDTSREFQRQLNMTQEAVMTDDDGKFRIAGAMPGVFRLTFSLDNKRYRTNKKWDDIRTVASTLIPVGGLEIDLGDITVNQR